MSVRVRFAPSPTGRVHIGNIRTAIFNWLFARHEQGKFLLRVEDTDLERSTREAIDKLLECMVWLGLDYDEEVVYQTELRQKHLEAVDKLLADGNAYRLPGDDGNSQAVAFMIPWETQGMPMVRDVGWVDSAVHPDCPVTISRQGLRYATVSKKGKQVPESACLAGFKGLKIEGADGSTLFELGDQTEPALPADDSPVVIENAVKFHFLRREVFFQDLIKGELTKSLDKMKDIIIVRSDGSPVFHLANVCDDISQEITHVIRGNDHVENTYRHILLFQALGQAVPLYAHLPMIVNNQGKPYSKRDGDAYVGEFREKGYLAEALFNYLTLLGWAPGDDREKLNVQECVELFDIKRVKSHAAQFDIGKLRNLNGQYIAAMAEDKFLAAVRQQAASFAWYSPETPDKYKLLEQVARLMQIRTKVFAQVEEWNYFFSENIDFDRKLLRKKFNDQIRDALDLLSQNLESIPEFTPEQIEFALRKAEQLTAIGEGKLNQPLRLAITGSSSGADLVQTAALIGKERVRERIKQACLVSLQSEPES